MSAMPREANWGTYMIDKTTEGYEPTQDQVAGMLRNLCAYALSEPEPLQRYVELTYQQALFDGLVAAIRRERGRALRPVRPSVFTGL